MNPVAPVTKTFMGASMRQRTGTGNRGAPIRPSRARRIAYSGEARRRAAIRDPGRISDVDEIGDHGSMTSLRCARLSRAIVARARLVTLLALAGLALALEPAIARAGDGAAGEPIVRPYRITEEREPCRDYTPLRRPFFGDTHVHTARSQDASTQDTRVSPADAYRFARGARLDIQPFDASGRSLRSVQLDRPLDFTAVTDHANQIGEVHICETPGAPGHRSLVCLLYRHFPRVAFYVMNARYSVFQSRWSFCGKDDRNCLEAAGIVWEEHQRAAEQAYDRSARCEFTTFVAYEWTAADAQAGHLHRNVIFRNERVPALPISVMETGGIAMNLWKRLDAECRDGRPGCEALTIPHNSNWSNGSAFTSAIRPGDEIKQEEAATRARYDRLVEVMQHKGESECALVPGVTDEGCGFEKARNTNGIHLREEPLQAVNFARDALKRGLALEPELGTNPLKFGLIASTDTHLGTPGLVRERGFGGHGGAGKPGNRALEPGFHDITTLNPGGLAVLWAEENTRDALFEAMLRKEAYGTSGTRPVLRFFGGWNYPSDACGSANLAELGYAGGVPMGGDLPPRAPGSRKAPVFLVAASRDPDPEAGDLERIEIVKGWVEGGERKEAVLTVAGGPNGSSVDLATCEREGTGRRDLCSVWRDPDFDPDESAFYYVRLRENPSCRWTQWACVDAGVDCADPATIGEGFEACCSGELPATIQERAWSSPIWYTPPSEPAS
jgi:hypothetical protein